MGTKKVPIDETEAAALQHVADKVAELGLTIDQLSQKANTPRTRTYESIKGRRSVSVSDFVALCHAVGLVPWRVLREAEDKITDPHGPPAPTTPHDPTVR